MPQADPAATAQASSQEETGIFIYDAIMSAIEPELVSTEVPKLEEKYKGETDAERMARAKRYEQAYDRYDEHYAIYIKNVKLEAQKLKRQALSSAESEERAKEEEEMASLESTISNF